MMRLNFAYKPFYLKNGIDETTYTKEAYAHYEKLVQFKRLINEGCSQVTALSVLNVSRSTYYRWLRVYQKNGLKGFESNSRRPHKMRQPSWKKDAEEKVKLLRKTYPL